MASHFPALIALIQDTTREAGEPVSEDTARYVAGNVLALLDSTHTPGCDIGWRHTGSCSTPLDVRK